MTQRNENIDFLKSVFILLMILFHLVYIGDKYPYLKSVVYTFHMSGFLLLSGLLMNTAKSPFQFFKTLLWLFVPYAVMETGYVLMAAVLPIREHIETLTPLVFLEKLLVHPLGPYWYLHTLILCSLAAYGCLRLPLRHTANRFFLLGLVFFLFSEVGLLSWDNALYFGLGVVLRQSRLSFSAVFRPSFLSLLPLALLCSHPDNLHRGTLPGLFITYLSFSLLLALYPHLPLRVRTWSNFVGRNTLPLLLFSPIFTLLCKPLVAVFSFDRTGVLFAVVALFISVSGSFIITRAMKLSGVARFFFGDRKVLV
ncbi:acyltransferase [Alloprevotella sp. OH1205_COT-284]|uniref:acyltransferase family protein n=1 Tax=Alloprevotella sp. OH1205_COT-284 TaxID=2491043 RepID=UPI000F5FC5E7|nr:acyltransferase family protein [Alloprevotella sp. OH1205_COT-284]RRD80838.1 acyltransferase [Alloprevotella sp. OH1205_COT-284]